MGKGFDIFSLSSSGAVGSRTRRLDWRFCSGHWVGARRQRFASNSITFVASSVRGYRRAMRSVSSILKWISVQKIDDEKGETRCWAAGVEPLRSVLGRRSYQLVGYSESNEHTISNESAHLALSERFEGSFDWFCTRWCSPPCLGPGFCRRCGLHICRPSKLHPQNLKSIESDPAYSLNLSVRFFYAITNVVLDIYGLKSVRRGPSCL